MKIRELRVINKLTQEKIAKIIGITQFTYSNYENEKTQPDIETLCKLADFYGVSLDYLCGHETKNVIDISDWSDIKKSILLTVDKLTEQNKTILLGYLTHMLYEQNKQY